MNCTKCGKWAGAHATLPGQPRDHLCMCERPSLPQAGRAMRPTESLRFVERSFDNGDGTSVRVRVLQQQWGPVHGGPCEWRDVPLVVEP